MTDTADALPEMVAVPEEASPGGAGRFHPIVLTVLGSYLAVVWTTVGWRLAVAVSGGTAVAKLGGVLSALKVALGLVIGCLALIRRRLPQPSAGNPWRAWRVLTIGLAVFPLPYVLSAITYLVRVGHGQHPARLPNPVPGSVAASVAWSTLDQLSLVAAAVGTVCLLLHATGDQLSDLGFGGAKNRRDLRLDARRTMFVFMFGFGAQIVVVRLLGLLPLPTTPPPALRPVSALFAIYGVAAALAAGLCEEVVVLGFLVGQLERARWRPAAVAGAAVLVRMSFHVYYGAAVVSFGVWAAVWVVLYQRYRPRRLWPFIAAHALWDVQAFVVGIFGAVAVLGTVPMLVAVLSIGMRAGAFRFLQCQGWLLTARPEAPWPAGRLADLLPELRAAIAAALTPALVQPAVLVAATTAPGGAPALYVVAGQMRLTRHQRRARRKTKKISRQARSAPWRDRLWLLCHPAASVGPTPALLAAVTRLTWSAELDPPGVTRRVSIWRRAALVAASERVVTSDEAPWQAAQLASPWDAGEWPAAAARRR